MVGDDPVHDIRGALGAGWAHAVRVSRDPPADAPAGAAVVAAVSDAPAALGL